MTETITATGMSPAVVALFIFVLACFIGYYVIWGVTPSLHTLIHETPSPELLFRSDGEAFRMALFESARRLAAELRYAGLLEVKFKAEFL